jgi:hypothetical protein
MRLAPLPRFPVSTDTAPCDIETPKYRSEQMKVLLGAIVAAGLLAGCISSSNPNPPPQKTTVVVPPGSTTTVVCQNGNPPPCD